ncbi:phage protein, HK97 gp10 family [Alkalithermobacter thermoalcaliphilus JW-YL-7 = DSM 7308]|uniref:Phage protein, HK97 gp10 family n=1 Tax=Alkalithermobacter thermoalcaliphilus JW-YL-7 = DSM 7308 TaxID=1121328 RepID=A0A150FQW6_CLOPD|nr:phage protein, HK97 gp10 family [[Clostridium] paradoxum JW-YL-7 = DSM 7308]SHL13665.1 phage protein, HK97 gp10 family [[Clostridium] paradoxum JW-YL-7 = DSM 7308]
MSITVEVKNLEKTLKKMALYSKEKEIEIDSIVKKTAKGIASKAKSLVPVKTGNLKSSIKPKYFRKKGPSATVFPRGKKGAHRHLLEYGTKQRRHKSGKSTGRVNPRLFMTPAHRSYENVYLSEIKKVVDKIDVI